MQNIIEICKEFGFEVPDDKQKDFTSKVAQNYTTKNEVEKLVAKLEGERDKFKADAESATETLKGFEGKDFDKMQREVDEWKEKAEKAESEYKSKLAEREKQDLLSEAFGGIEFTSESAKRAIMDDVSKSVIVKDGKLIGFNDLIDAAKKNDASAFKETDPEASRARFTGRMDGKGGSGGAKMTMSELMKYKNEHPDVDITSLM